MASVKPLAVVLLFFTANAHVAAGDAGTAGVQAQEQIYGSQLMTPEEREEHRTRMRAAKSAEECEQIRAEHHALMQERARQLGINLPDEPPERGTGPGRGMGPCWRHSR